MGLIRTKFKTLDWIFDYGMNKNNSIQEVIDDGQCSYIQKLIDDFEDFQVDDEVLQYLSRHCNKNDSRCSCHALRAVVTTLIQEPKNNKKMYKKFDFEYLEKLFGFFKDQEPGEVFKVDDLTDHADKFVKHVKFYIDTRAHVEGYVDVSFNDDYTSIKVLDEPKLKEEPKVKKKVF